MKATKEKKAIYFINTGIYFSFLYSSITCHDKRNNTDGLSDEVIATRGFGQSHIIDNG